MPNLTLKIEGEAGRVPGSIFAMVLTESLAILEELRESIAPMESISWYVADLKISSATATLATYGTSEAPVNVGLQFVRGLHAIESGDELPPFFSDRSLNRLIKMSRPLGTEGAEYLESSFGGDYEVLASTKVTRQSSANVKKLQQPKSRAIGSITGVLETITAHGRNKFYVFDLLSRRAVACSFSDEAIEAVKDAFKRRVVVSGLVNRNSKGQPISIEEGEFEAAMDGPPLLKLVGLDRTFTGGMSNEEYRSRISS